MGCPVSHAGILPDALAPDAYSRPPSKPGDRQGRRGLLPEVRRRVVQTRDQGHSRDLRPHPAGGRPPPVRAEEVRRSRCPRSSPKVLPLKHSAGVLVAGGRGVALPMYTTVFHDKKKPNTHTSSESGLT